MSSKLLTKFVTLTISVIFLKMYQLIGSRVPHTLRCGDGVYDFETILPVDAILLEKISDMQFQGCSNRLQ